MPTKHTKVNMEKVPVHISSDSELHKSSECHIKHLRREQTHLDIDPIIDKRLNRKFDLHVIPFLFGIW